MNSKNKLLVTFVLMLQNPMGSLFVINADVSRRSIEKNKNYYHD